MTSYLTRIARLSLQGGSPPAMLPAVASAWPQVSTTTDGLGASALVTQAEAGSAISGLPSMIDRTFPVESREAKPAQQVGFEATPTSPDMQPALPTQPAAPAFPAWRELEQPSETVTEFIPQPTHSIKSSPAISLPAKMPAPQPAAEPIPLKMRQTLPTQPVSPPLLRPPESDQLSVVAAQPVPVRELPFAALSQAEAPAPASPSERPVDNRFRDKAGQIPSLQPSVAPEPKHTAAPVTPLQPSAQPERPAPVIQPGKPAPASSSTLSPKKIGLEQKTLNLEPASTLNPSVAQPVVLPNSRATPSLTLPPLTTWNTFPARPSRPEAAPPLTPVRPLPPAAPLPQPAPATPIAGHIQIQPDKPTSRSPDVRPPAIVPIHPANRPATLNPPKPARQEVGLSIGQIDVTVVNQPAPPPARRAPVGEGSSASGQPEAFLARQGLAWFQLKR